jgi:hypothetical protein
VERLDDYPDEYAHFFHNNICNVTCILDSKIERLGYTMGRIFVDFDNQVYREDEDLSVNELHERMSELKEVHPELSKNRYWHSFEDNAFSKNPDVWDKIDLESTDNNGVEYWLENMEFSKKNGYKKFRKMILTHVFNNIIQKL